MSNTYRTLIGRTELAAQLNTPDWIIFDCRFRLTEPEAGRWAYAEGHIPGARYAHLDRDLAGTVSAASGRHPLPDPEAFAAWLGSRGVGPATQVVAYDDMGGAIAARLWWMLRWLGHEAVAVLDGGLPAWEAAGLPISDDLPDIDPARFTAAPRPDWTVDGPELAGALGSGRYRIIDVRETARHAGREEPIDPVAGHVPGALNLPFQANLDDTGMFRTASALRETYTRLLGAADGEGVVTMCGSGVTACHTLLALELADMPGGRLYPGSWSEWIRDPARPVARG